MKKKKLVNNIIIGAIFIISICVMILCYKDSRIKDTIEYEAKNIGMMFDINNEIQPEEIIEKEYDKAEVVKEYKGYKVLAKLEIPDIKLETYILKKCTEDSLNKAVAKFWGVNPNQIR